MGLFSKHEAFGDSVYARRLARGEVQERPIIISRPNELEILRREVKELTEENRRLRKEIASYQEEVSRMKFVNDMDELIEAMKKETTKPSSSAGIFDALLKAKPATSDASDTSGTKLFSPETNIVSELPDNAEFEDGEVAENEIDWNDEER